MTDLERELLKLKERASSSIAPSPEMATRVFRRTRIRRIVTGTSGVVVAVALGLGSVAVVRAFDAPTLQEPVGPQPGVETPSPADLNPHVTATVDVGPFPRSVEVGYGFTWVTVDDPEGSSPFALTRIDPSTNEIIDSLPLKNAADTAMAAGSVWVISYEDAQGARLLRIDPETNSVIDSIPLDCVSDLDPPDCFPVNVAGDDTAIWVSLSSDPALSGEVVRIDPARSQIVARIPIDEGGPRDIVVGGDSVWVNVLSDVKDDVVQGGSLVRIDPQANAVVDTLLRDKLLLGGNEFPPVMAADDGSVWVVKEESQGATVPADVLALRINALTGEVISESGNLVPNGRGPTVFPFAADDGSLWFYGGGEVAVRRLNAQTMEVDESVNLSDDAINGIDAVMDPVAGTIWFASYEGPVIRIDLH